MSDRNISKLLTTIESASAGFNGKLPAIEKKLLGEVLLLLKQFEVKNGKVSSNMANLKLLNKIKGKLEKLVFSKEYVKDVAEFVRAYSTIAGIQEDYFKGLNKGFKAKEYYSALKEVAVNNTIEGLTESGVRANVIKPVTDLLLTGITSGQSYAQLEESLRQTLTETQEGAGALSRYAKTYTIDSVNQFSREYMTAITHDLAYEWYVYRGTNLETTREFCELLTKKEYIHKSEIPEILQGKIDGHQCRIYDKTGLPYGMKEGTDAENFQANCGGWNCGHALIPVPEKDVPEGVRNRIKNNATFAGISESIISVDKAGLVKAAKEKYHSYGDEWTKVYFNKINGGYNVYHKDHKFTHAGGGGEAEKTVGKMLAKYNGKQVEFLPEGWKKQPDVKFDGKTWDIKYIDHANEETIRAAIRDARKADNAIFYFTDASKYVLLNNAMEREVGRFLKGQTNKIPDIYGIDKNGLLKLIWEKTKEAK